MSIQNKKWEYKSDNLVDEFKILNNYHYEIIKSVKSVVVETENEKQKDMLLEIQSELLQEIKKIFQEKINENECF